MKLGLASIMVTDQEHAHVFYTKTLGFTVKNDMPMGSFRWLTVASAENDAGMELLLEPIDFPPAREYQAALFKAGKPAAAFFTDDIDADFRRLTSLGVVFRGEPTVFGAIKAVVFEDSCGNLINLVQPLQTA